MQELPGGGEGLGCGGGGDGLGCGGGGGFTQPPEHEQIWATLAPLNVGISTPSTACGATCVHNPEERLHVPLLYVVAPSDEPVTSTSWAPPTYTFCSLDATSRLAVFETALKTAFPLEVPVVEKSMVPTSPLMRRSVDEAWLM